MDNDQMLNEIQKLLEGSEQRIGARIDGLVVRLDSIDRKVSLHNGVLTHLVEWSDKYEAELVRVSKELSDVKMRLLKLENKEAA